MERETPDGNTVKTDTKERIQQKANELFFRYGVRSITMDEIALQCGISKKTIYQFFEDKDALVEAVIENEIGVKEAECRNTQQVSDNAIDEVFIALKNVLALFDRLHPNVLFDLHKHHPEAFEKVNCHRSQFLVQIMIDNIKRGQQEGLYRPEADATILGLMRLDIIFSLIRQEIYPRSYSQSQLLQETTYHYLYGLATDKGKKLIEEYLQEGNPK